MKTIHDGPHLMVAAQSDKTPGVPPGQFRICTVRYATFEFSPGEFDQTKWTVHDANSEEARRIAELVNMPPEFAGEFGLQELRAFAQLRKGAPVKAAKGQEIRQYLADYGAELETQDLALCLKSSLFNELFQPQLEALRNVAMGRMLEQTSEGAQPAVGISRQEIANLARDWTQDAAARGIMRDMTSTTTANVLTECAAKLRALLGNG